MKITQERLMLAQKTLEKEGIYYNGNTWQGKPEKALIKAFIDDTGEFSPEEIKQILMTVEYITEERQPSKYNFSENRIEDIVEKIDMPENELMSNLHELNKRLLSIHPYAVNLLTYCLYEETPVNQPVIVLYGSGGNGKGVIMEDILKRILRKKMSNIDLQTCDDKEVYRVLNSDALRVCYEDEFHSMGAKAKRFIKMFAEGTPIKAKKLYKDSIEITPQNTTMLVISTNESVEPFISTRSMKRRSFVLYFKNSFARDIEFDEFIKKSVPLVPILCKLVYNHESVNALIRYFNSVLSEKDVVQIVLGLNALLNKTDYRAFKRLIDSGMDESEHIRNKSALDDFLDLYCEVKPGHNALCTQFYSEFTKFCKSNNERVLSVSALGKELASKGIFRQRNSVRIPGTDKKISAYTGVMMKKN